MEGFGIPENLGFRKIVCTTTTLSREKGEGSGKREKGEGLGGGQNSQIN
jgi:hypothetical protein